MIDLGGAAAALTGGLAGGAAGAVAGLVAGLAGGLAHFGSLHAVVRRLQRGATAGALALQGVRLALTGALLFACAKAGAAPLLGAGAGLLAARAVVLRRLPRPRDGRAARADTP
ncbi:MULTISPECIES: ATP synthase subunit I [Cupriavidus]|uniref:N-ATPase subunit AtpR n=1 Tax=Cupriavidus TaxID=106589 RepID=UPI0009F3E780|nr:MULTISPECIES: ATP synthase subunit I [Cupriavidus]